MKSSSNGKRAPLRTLLQNFLNHVETMETKRSQGDDQYDREFQELKLLSESLKVMEAFSSKEGEKEVNRKKNRYKDILPFDYTRVILSEFPGVPGSDYINANYIRGASGSNAYIASQGPLAHTVTDFWRMIVECEVQVVVMACNEEESGKHKCECYWVDSENDSKKYGPYSVKLLKFRRHCSDFSIRTMELSYVNSEGETVSRTIVQFHYWAWPDHGVPNLVRPLLEMVRLIRDCQASETLPLLVHCSAGCGRTGTICAIDYVWGLLKTGKLSEDFRLFELIADMRRQRVAMVQTKDQYVLVHQAVKELFLDQLKMIDAHPYENLDVNGHPLICPVENERVDPSYETIFANCSEGVLEVREEDDNCFDSFSSQGVPWPVLHFQAELEKQQGENETAVHRKGMAAPPLPDKKRKSSEKGAVLSTYDNVTSSGSSSKESSPPNSLERGDSNNSSCEKLEVETVKSKSSSPSQSLVRKPSILKLRALFERSGSEPRGSEKRSKSTSRKASSFRFNEAPRLQRAAESDPEANSKLLSASSSTSAGSYKEFYKPPKLSLAKTALLAEGQVTTRAAERPSLPVKRSKSMKVYRNFDVAVRSKSPEEAAITPAPCDIVLSKTPSITYVSSKEVLHSPTPSTELLVSPLDSLPLATSSLDRAKEHKPKVTSPVCGSLDRGSQSAAQTKDGVPTYVNILMKNQEVSKLDDDTRQLLRDCQAYLMSSDDAPPVERTTAEAIAQLARDAHQRLMAVSEARKDKSARNVPPGERKESFKQAVLPEAELSSRSDEAKKKTHEYEAVWLGSKPVTSPSSGEEINANSLVSKDSIFVQKSDEIRHLLNELRSSPAEEQARTTTAALQPERVLSELQQLVEESNKLHSETGRKPAYVNYPQPSPRDPGKVTSPVLVRKDLSGAASKPRETKTLPPPKHSPSSSLITPTQAPAFRPPPPYPTNLVVKLPPLAAESDPPPPKPDSRRKVAPEPEAQASAETSPRPHRRPPPEYKAPPDPPVKRPVQASPSVQPPPSAPVAPPRVKKTISSTKSSPVSAGAFPLGPPVPTRTFSSQQAAAAASSAAPGIDLDAVAAGMAATTTGIPPPKNRSSPNPSAAANRALSKALGKFQATAASFKTKLAQLGSEEKTGSSPSSSAVESTAPAAAAHPLPKMTRESSFVKSLTAYGSDAGVVNTSEATTYVRKKQQYL